MELKNIAIYSDMDGTLLTDWALGPIVPQCNLESITRLKNEGGSFSIASGRQYTDSLSCLPEGFCNAPSVQNNGALIYDCVQKHVLEKCPLPQRYKEECAEFVKANPDCWLVASSEVAILQIDFGDERDHTLHDWERDHIPLQEFLDNPFYKVAYIVEPPRMPSLKRQVMALENAPLVNCNQSAPIYLECFDRSVDKGRGVRRAMKLGGITDKTLVCIGDYFNDLSMLMAADIAACPANAPDEIKAVCKIVTRDNNQGAIADLIDQLEAL